eukprot:59190_1
MRIAKPAMAITYPLFLFLLLTCISIIHSTQIANYTATTPSAIQHSDPDPTLQKIDTQPTYHVDSVIAQLESIDPLIWIIIGLVFVICCLSSLMICYCVMQRKFHKELLTIHATNGIPLGRVFSNTVLTSSAPHLKMDAATTSNRSCSFDPSGPSQRTEITSLQPPTLMHSRSHSPYSIVINEAQPSLPAPIGLPRSKSADHGLLEPINSDKMSSVSCHHKPTKSLSSQLKPAHPLSFKPRDSTGSITAAPELTELTRLTSMSNVSSLPPVPMSKTRSLPMNQSSMVYTENYPVSNVSVQVIEPQPNAYEPPPPPPPQPKVLTSTERMNRNLQYAMNALAQEDPDDTNLNTPNTAGTDQEQTMSYAWTETGPDDRYPLTAVKVVGINQKVNNGIAGMLPDMFVTNGVNKDLEESTCVQ